MSNPVYPAAVKTWIDKVDYRDTVLAEHVNSLQAEVTSVEKTLGTRILSSDGFVGTFDSATTVWGPQDGGLAARIQNIEYGIRGDVHAQYVRKTADSGNVITPADAGTIGLTIAPFSGQAADLLVAGAAKIDADGTVYSDGAPVLTTSTTQTMSGKTLSGLNNTFSDIPVSAVIVTGSTDIKEYVDAAPRIIYSASEPSTAGVPLGSVWVDSDSSPTAIPDLNSLVTITHPNTHDVHVKTYDSGLSRWQTVFYDSGIREVTRDAGAATNHPGLSLMYLRRVNNTVTLSFTESANSAAGTGLTTVYTIPDGFKAIAGRYGATALLNVTTGAVTGSANTSNATTVQVYRTAAVRQFGCLTWTTADAIPTALPGALSASAPA